MDLNTNAYRIVHISTGDIARKSEQKSKAGKLGALARAKSLPRAKRKKIALRANRARWNNHRP
jgi:hypothetical protein